MQKQLVQQELVELEELLIILIHLNQQIHHLITPNQLKELHILILQILPAIQLITKHLLVIQVVAHTIPVKVPNKHNHLLKINNYHLKVKLLEKLAMSHVNLRILF